MSFSARGSIELEVAQARRAVSLVAGDLRELGRTAETGFSSLSSTIVKNEQHINELGRNITVAGAALTGLFGVGLKTAADFEVGMNRVQALSNATADEFENLKQTALDLSQTTRYTANEIADAMGFLAMAGFDVNEIMAALPGTLNLAAAAQMDLGRAADLSTNILTAFGMEASQLDETVDKLVYGFTNSNTSMEQLGEAFKYVGPVAKAAGLSIDEVVALLGRLGDAGIQGSMAGTTLRGAITRLINPPGQAAKALDALGVSTTDANNQMLPMVDILRQFPPVSADAAAAMGEISAAADNAGISLEDASGNARPMSEVLADMEAQGIDTSSMLAKLGGDADTVGQIMDIFGLRAGPGMLALLSQGSEGLAEFTAQIADSGGTAQRVADTQLRGLTGSLNLLRAAWQSLMIRAMDSGPIQAISGFVRMLTSMVSAIGRLPGPILGVMATLTGLTGVLLTFGGVFLLLLPRIARTYQAVIAFQKWGGVSRAVTMLTGNMRLLNQQMMMTPGPAGRASTAIANLIATMRADGVLRTFRNGLMNIVRMHPALVGFGLIAGSIGLAYKTNFLGIGDAIDNVIGKVRGVAEAMRTAFGQSQSLDIAVTGDDKVLEWVANPDSLDGSGFDYMVRIKNPDGSLEAFGQVVESYTDPDDPNIAHIKVQGEDGEYWTTVNKTTGEVGEGYIKVEGDPSPLHERINAALEVLRGSFESAGIGWAATIVGNLQTVVTFIAGIAGRISTAFSAVGAVLSNLGLDRLSGFFTTLATGVIVLAPLIVGLKLLAGVILAVLSPAVLVVGAIAALAAGIVYAYQNFEPFRKIVNSVASALSKFARNQAATFLRDLGRWISDAAKAIGDFLKGVNDVVRPLNLLRTGASALGAFLVAAFQAGRTGVTVLISAMGPIFEHFQNIIALAQALGEVLIAVFQGDWSGAWDALQVAARAAITALISSFTALPRTIINLFQAVDWGALWAGIRDSVSNISWGDIGRMIVSAARAMISGLRVVAELAIELLGRLIDGIGSGIATFWDWVKTQAAALAGWVSDLVNGDPEALSRAASIVTDIIGSVVDALSDGAATFWAWVKKAITGAASWVTSLMDGDPADLQRTTSIISTIGGGLISTAFSGASSFWSWVKDRFSSIPKLVKSLIDGNPKNLSRSTSIIATIGGGLITSVFRGAASFWEWVKDKFSGLPQLLQTLVNGDPEDLERVAGIIVNIAGSLAGMAKETWNSAWDWIADKSPQWLKDIINGVLNREVDANVTVNTNVDLNEDGLVEPHEQYPDYMGPPVQSFGGFDTKSGHLPSTLEALRKQLLDVVAYNDEAWRQIVDDTHQGALESRNRAEGEYQVLGTNVPQSTSQMAGAVAGDMGRIRGAVASESGKAQATATSNFATMGSKALASTIGMQAGVVSRVSAMQLATGLSMLTMKNSAVTQASDMSSTVGLRMAAMQLNAGLKMRDMVSSAKSAGTDMSDGLTSWFSSASLRLSMQLLSMGLTIRGFGSTGYNAGYYAGSQISLGFANGMSAYLGQIRAAGNAMVAEASRAVIARAMISSPSRLFQQYGEYIGEGLEIGILRSIPDIGRAADRMLDASLPSPAFNTPMRGAGGGTQVINNYYQQDVKVMTSAEWEAYKQKSDRGNQAYNHLSDPDAFNYGGGI